MINGNKVNGFLKDEEDASKEYYYLALEEGLDTRTGQMLMLMSKDEQRHHEFWREYKRLKKL